MVGRLMLLGVGPRHSWLRAWPVALLAGLPVRPSGVSGGPSPGGGLLGSLGLPLLCAFVVRAVLAYLCVVCVCGACVGGSCGGVCFVRAGVGVLCWWCVWVPALASRGLGWRLCVGVRTVCRGPSPALAVGPWCGSPPLLAGVCWCWCVPPPPPLRALPPLSLGCVAWRAVPLVPCPGPPGLFRVCGGAGWGGGSLTLAQVPSPGVSPSGG